MRRTLKILGWLLAGVVGVILLGGVALMGLYVTADVEMPDLKGEFPLEVTRENGVTKCGESRLRRSQNGFWEMCLVGDAEQRGSAFGAMADSLLQHQEEIFIRQIHEIVPNNSYLSFLNILTQVFNREITHHIPDEYCREIAAMSRYGSHAYDQIGSSYLRQLNYHAAHDIGHAMQDYMLVGCTAVGAWGEQTEDGLLVGRNFDFWVGDDFAENRLLTFCKPAEGHSFVSIGWFGMVGVMSGMNEEGLTVTLNAAKGDLPLKSATPVSILAREMLQYASTIDEAVEIASRRQLFVSECFLIGSVKDGRCAVIEKTPHGQDVYTTEGEWLCLSNHFRSQTFENDPQNRENIQGSDSKYRLERIEELTQEKIPLNVCQVVDILRDRDSLGWVNPMAINQQIAHHSVAFEPEALRMWLSTEDWGYGDWVCYDVGAILRGEKSFEGEICCEEVIPRDSLFSKARVEEWRSLKSHLGDGEIDHFVELNPQNWESYAVVADWMAQRGRNEEAKSYYEEALRHRMTRNDEQKLKQKLKDI